MFSCFPKLEHWREPQSALLCGCFVSTFRINLLIHSPFSYLSATAKELQLKVRDSLTPLRRRRILCHLKYHLGWVSEMLMGERRICETWRYEWCASCKVNTSRNASRGEKPASLLMIFLLWNFVWFHVYHNASKGGGLLSLHWCARAHRDTNTAF